MAKGLHQRLTELGFIVDELIPKNSAQLMKVQIAAYAAARDPFIIVDGELVSDVKAIREGRLANVNNSYVFYSRR